MDFKSFITKLNNILNENKKKQSENHSATPNNEEEQFHDNCRKAIAEANCIMNPDKTE